MKEFCNFDYRIQNLEKLSQRLEEKATIRTLPLIGSVKGLIDFNKQQKKICCRTNAQQRKICGK